MTNSQQVIFVDMDGTVTDWYTPAAKLLNLDITSPEVQNALMSDYEGMDKLVGRQQFREIIRNAGWSFWADMGKLPWCDELLERVRAANLGDMAFLSKPEHWPDAYKGKALWVEREYPNIPLILCRQKGMVASPTSCLVDDDKIQADWFHARGGRVYRWPNQFLLLQRGEKYWRGEIDSLLTWLKTITEYNPDRQWN